MRRNRLVFLTLWLLSLTGISFYGGAVSYGIFFMMTLIPVISLIYLICVFICFRLYQKAETRYPTAGHAVPFFFTLVNEFRFGFTSIRVRLFSSFSTITGLDDDVTYELHPGGQIVKKTQLICKYRGEYEVGIKEILIEDYFRLICLKYKNREALRVNVMPDLIELTHLKSLDLNRISNRERPGKDVLPDVLSREYLPGDDVRLINWKLSAMTGKPMIRERIGEEQEHITILLGTQRMQEDIHSYLPPENKILEIVLALSLYLVKQNIPVRTFTCASDLKEHSVSAIGAFESYYRDLSGISFRENTTEKELLVRAASDQDLLKTRLLVMILQELSAEAVDLAGYFSGNSIPVAVYLVRSGKVEGSAVTDLNDTQILMVDPEADLREVL